MQSTHTSENNIKSIGKRLLDYFIKTLNGMALGLFSTLIIGTIIGTIGKYVATDNIALLNYLSKFLINLSILLKALTGVGIGIGIAWSLKLDGLRLIVAGIAGGIASGLATGVAQGIAISIELGKPGDPLVEYLTVIASIELTRLILRKKTPIDIIIVPLISSIIAYSIYLIINTPVSNAMMAIGNFIKWATERQPFIMGIIIAVTMGMILTAPISSAAIAIAIQLGGLAGGAAVVGCAVQMLGFAVMSRKDNNIGTVISVGVGTSMLQFKNILRKPIIWLPTIIVSAILGPVATLLIKTYTYPIGSGMGTSGFVGQIATIDAMSQLNLSTNSILLSIIVLQIILPIVLVYIVDLYFRKKGWIKVGDLKI